MRFAGLTGCTASPPLPPPGSWTRDTHNDTKRTRRNYSHRQRGSILSLIYVQSSFLSRRNPVCFRGSTSHYCHRYLVQFLLRLLFIIHQNVSHLIKPSALRGRHWETFGNVFKFPLCSRRVAVLSASTINLTHGYLQSDGWVRNLRYFNKQQSFNICKAFSWKVANSLLVKTTGCDPKLRKSGDYLVGCNLCFIPANLVSIIYWYTAG